MFMQGDVVRYVGGGRLAVTLKKKEIRKGEVLAPMGNEPGVYTVEFGEDAYVLPEHSLAKYVASAQDLEAAAKEPEVLQKKRRRNTDED